MEAPASPHAILGSPASAWPCGAGPAAFRENYYWGEHKLCNCVMHLYSGSCRSGSCFARQTTTESVCFKVDSGACVTRRRTEATAALFSVHPGVAVEVAPVLAPTLVPPPRLLTDRVPQRFVRARVEQPCLPMLADGNTADAA